MKGIIISILLLGQLVLSGQSTQKISNEQVYSSNLDSAMLHCYTMIKLGYVDSLMGECRMGATNQDCMFALAYGFAAKGERNSAHFYLLQRFRNDLTQLPSVGNPYDILNHYFISYSLAADSELLLKMERLFKTHYLMLGYSQANIGLELYKLANMDQRIRYESYYWEDRCTSEQCRKELLNKYYGQDTLIQQKLFRLLDKNGGLYSPEQVGPASSQQNIILYHVSDISLREKKVEPWLKKAMEQGLVSSLEYADAVVRTAQIKRMPDNYLDSLKTSLYKAAGVQLHITR